MNAFEFYGFDGRGIALSNTSPSNCTVKISEDDKVLRVEKDGGLLAQIGLGYDHKKHTLKLIGKENKPLGEVELPLAIKKLVSSSFDSENTSIILQFENIDGSKGEFSLDVKDLLNIYQGSDGITISDGNVIALKLNESNNALTLDENGLGLDLTDIKENISSLSGSIDSIEVVKVDDFTFDIEINGTSLGTIDIPKNQVLKNIEVSGTTLIFEFYTEDGSTKTIEVDLSKFVDMYESGDGLKLEDNTFSVVIDPTSEEYLTVSENGIKFEGLDSFTPTYAKNAEYAETAFDAVSGLNAEYLTVEDGYLKITEGNGKVFDITVGNAANAYEAIHATASDNAATADHSISSDSATNAFGATNGLSDYLGIDENGKLTVLGAPIHETVEHALSADNAANADEAVHATSADEAIKADKAIYADNAASADEAVHATSADNSLKADEAVHATSADNSLKADEAVHALNADNSLKADEAEHAISADEALFAVSANSAEYAAVARYAESYDETEINNLKQSVYSNSIEIADINLNGSDYVRNSNFASKDELDKYALQSYAEDIDANAQLATTMISGLTEGLKVEPSGEIKYLSGGDKPFDELWTIVHNLVKGMDEKNIKPLKDILESLDKRITALEERG